MLTDVQRDYLAKLVRPMQIIIGSHAAGVASFLAFVLVIVDGDAPSELLLTYVALGFAAMAFAGWLIAPNIVVNRARRYISEGRTPPSAVHANVPSEVGVAGQLASVFRARRINASALLEGAAFFGLIAYMIERRYLGVVIAVVLLLVIVCQIPTRSRLEDWVSHELENIEQMRT